MHVRPLTRPDIPAVVDITFDAFMDDELNERVWPLRRKHPITYRRSSFLHTKLFFVTPSSYPVVCVADAGDSTSAPGEILGIALWEFQAPTPASLPNKPPSATLNHFDAARRRAQHRARNTSVACALERAFIKAELKYRDVLALDQSVAPAEWARLLAASSDHEKLPGHWNLMMLAVAPAHQRKGVGVVLTRWGQERAREEGVPASLSSSAIAAGMYKKCGFMTVDWMSMAIECEWKGGRILVWDPWGLWIRPLKEERAGRGGRMVDAEWVE